MFNLISIQINGNQYKLDLPTRLTKKFKIFDIVQSCQGFSKCDTNSVGGNKITKASLKAI